MAKFVLTVKEANTTTLNEHELWLLAENEKLPKYLQFDALSAIVKSPLTFSILGQPQFWSGSRMFEAKITAESKDAGIPCYKFIMDELVKKTQQYEDEPEKVKAIQAFAKKYEKYFETLKKRALLLAISQTVRNIKSYTACNETYQSKLHLFSRAGLSPFKLQTREDCSKKHEEIVNTCKELQPLAKVNADLAHQIRQVEILSKRYNDLHLDKAKKSTVSERTIHTISTVSSTLGLVTGLAAAALGLGGLVFPPLLVPAAILGFISMASYISTAVTAYEIINSGAHKRSPSKSLVISLALDIALLPIAFLGGKIMSTASKAIAQGHVIFNSISFSLANVSSNLFPDLFQVNELVKDNVKMVKNLSEDVTLKHTPTATSCSAVQGDLVHVMSASAAFEKINATKAAIRDSDKASSTATTATTESKKSPTENSTVINNRGFARLLLDKENTKNDGAAIKHTKSYHAHILYWDKGFFSTGTSANAKNIYDAVKKYEELDPNSNCKDVHFGLYEIRHACAQYIANDANKTSRRYPLVVELHKNVTAELKSLEAMVAHRDGETAKTAEEIAKTPLTLVGYKSK